VNPGALNLLVLAAALLAVGVTLVRLHRVERENRELRSAAAPPDTTREGLAALGVLLGDMCHRIVGSLTVILGQCELGRISPSSERRLATIEAEARRLAATVERYRTGCRAWRDARSRIDPVRCARAAIEATARLAAERDVAVHEHFEEVPRVDANPLLLSQALVFMLRLAIESSPQGRGDVTLAVGTLPLPGGFEQVAFGVADDGPGIAPEALPPSLHPFPDVEGSASEAALGYATVQVLARAMGATLALDTAPGRGTRATLKLPVAVPGDVPAAAHAGEESPAALG